MKLIPRLAIGFATKAIGVALDSIVHVQARELAKSIFNPIERMAELVTDSDKEDGKQVLAFLEANGEAVAKDIIKKVFNLLEVQGKPIPLWLQKIVGGW